MRDAVTGRLWARLMLFDTDDLAGLTSVDLPAGAFPVGVLIGQSPPRPEALSATVTGNQVTLRWSPGSGVTPATDTTWKQA